MYGWLWNHLPGSPLIRVLLLALIAAIVIAVLFLWVFPIVDAWIGFDDSEVGAIASSQATLPAA